MNIQDMTKSKIISLLRSKNTEMRARFHAEITAVFGSYARNEQSLNSDLDVLYRVNEPDRFGLVEIEGLEAYIKQLIDVPSVDLVNEMYINPIIELEIKDDILYV